MNKVIPVCIFLASMLSTASAQTPTENTWTFTYLKAKEGQAENLREFLIKNWFVMDSIAVQRGLFNDYTLYENVSTPDSAKDWDYIVAVEYFTRGTYADIQDQWAAIRNGHAKVLVDGLDFPDLGSVVKSEEVVQGK